MLASSLAARRAVSVDEDGTNFLADQAFNVDYNDARQDVNRGEQDIANAPADLGRDAQQGFDNTVQGVKDVPSDLGGAVKGAADWIGDKVGGVQGDARRAEGDVNNFDNSVDQSYNQGEQQGQQQGGW
jgi:hypothetical protein